MEIIEKIDHAIQHYPNGTDGGRPRSGLLRVFVNHSAFRRMGLVGPSRDSLTRNARLGFLCSCSLPHPFYGNAESGAQDHVLSCHAHVHTG